MTAPRVGVVDYGAGNLFSVARGLRGAGARFDWVVDPDALSDYDAVLLPGVGAFAAGMARLRESGFDDALRAFAASGKAILGVCVGMQFLLSRSFEFGETAGLDLIPGDVERIDFARGWPVPNTGWRALRVDADLDDTPFADIRDGDAFYFAHSYQRRPRSDAAAVLSFRYGAHRICAAVRAANVFGCQFHPEVSGDAGQAVYRRFFAAA